jgi:ABC-type transport system involved in multi-copper enzyme maturation permease subunit
MSAIFETLVLTSRTTVSLLKKELLQNRDAYAFPLLLAIPLLIYLLLHSDSSLTLSPQATIVVVVAGAILAIVYGLMGLAGESDRKSLDFLLTRPIPPALLVLVKYLVNLGIYLLWVLCFTRLMKLDFSAFPLPKGMAVEWILLSLLVLQSTSFFAGLLVRGSERLVFIALLFSGMAGICYLLWKMIFDLITARYFWFDIPPHIYRILTSIFPTIVLICSLITPLVFVLWLVKGRPPIYKFRPIRRMLFVWLGLFGLCYLAYSTLGPSLWPISFHSHGGDWHPKSGVAVAGVDYMARKNPQRYLGVARIGGKLRPLITGTHIYSPRWSPDGKALAYVDNGTIKVYRHKKPVVVDTGYYPFWSKDGVSLAYIKMEVDEPSKVVVKQLDSGRTDILYQTDISQVLGFAWDSDSNRLFLLDRTGYLVDIQTKTDTIHRIKLETPIHLVMQRPMIVLEPEGKLLLSTTYEREFYINSYDPESQELKKITSRTGEDLDPVSQTIICLDGKGFLWPRRDGAYEYQGILPPHEHDHGHEHEHEHEHVHTPDGVIPK